MSDGPAHDLHEGFRDPRRVPAGDLERFLEQADRLSGMRAIRHELRQALDLRPGMKLLERVAASAWRRPGWPHSIPRRSSPAWTATPSCWGPPAVAPTMGSRT